MASVNLASILAAPQLTGLYSSIKPRIPDMWGPEFMTTQKRVHGRSGSYYLQVGNRTVAPENGYGSPSITAQQTQLSLANINCSHTFNSLLIPMTDIINLIKTSSTGSDLMIDEMGVEEITRQAAFAVDSVANRRIFLLNAMFGSGKAYFNGKGDPLATSSGATITVDWQVPASNQNQCSGIFDVPWDNATADIEQQLINLDQYATSATGYPIKRAYYGKNIIKYITGNPKMAAYLSRNQAINNDYSANGQIGKLGNISWTPAYNAFFQSPAVAPAVGTINYQIGDNEIVFMPDPSPAWMGWIEGSYAVPQSIEISKDMKAQTGKFQEQFGRFMWAESTTDAPAIKLLYGDTAIPVLNVPAAIYQATVTGF